MHRLAIFCAALASLVGAPAIVRADDCGSSLYDVYGRPCMSGSVAAVGAQVTTTTATITNGTSLSTGIDLGTARLSRIVIPAAWTAANITFQASADGVTYADLYDASGTEYTITVGGASRSIIVPLADFVGIRYVKVRSGTTGSPVNQGADRALTLVLVP